MAKEKVKVVNQGTGGGMLLVTYIGAAVYFVQRAHGFWPVVLALLKALVWPAYVVYQAMYLMHIH